MHALAVVNIGQGHWFNVLVSTLRRFDGGMH